MLYVKRVLGSEEAMVVLRKGLRFLPLKAAPEKNTQDRTNIGN